MGLRPLRCSMRWARQRLTFDQPHQLLHARLDAAVKIARLEIGRDGFGDHPLGDGVGNRALQSVAHFHAQSAVILGDDQDHPVVDFRAADLPFVGDADAELRDVFGWVVGTISTAIWLPFFASNAASLVSRLDSCSALSVAVRSVTRRDSSGTATWAQADSANSKQKKPNAERAQEQPVFTGSIARERSDASGPVAGAIRCRSTGWRTAAGAGAGAAGAGVPKSTLGGTAMAFSFSTVKLGLVL